MKEILCFGDSNTHGYIPVTGQRYPRDVRWSGRLEGILGPDYHVVEEGMDGRTTAFEDPLQPWRSGLGYLGGCIKSHAPLDLIVIMLGTNDAKTRYRVSAEEIGFGMRALVERIETFFSVQWRAIRALPENSDHQPGADARDGGDPEFNEASLQKQAALAGVYRQIAAQMGCGFAAAEDWIGPDLLERTGAISARKRMRSLHRRRRRKSGRCSRRPNRGRANEGVL